MEDLKKCLLSNGVAIAHVASHDDYICTFTNKGHYLVVYQYDSKNDKMSILDPSFSIEKFNTNIRRERVEIDKKIVWIGSKDLYRDTDARSPRRFYLFWN